MNTAHFDGVAGASAVTRRHVLQAGSAAMLGLSSPSVRQRTADVLASVRRERSCILLLLVGGPSQLDTFDPKPDAPAEVRSPYAAMRTNVRGIRISEILPRTARHADKYAIIRSVHHTAAAVHETGLQLMQTGRLSTGGIEWPHIGSVVGRLSPPVPGLPASVILPGPLGPMGANLSRGQTAGFLGDRFAPAAGDAGEPGASGGWRYPALQSALDVGGEAASLREAYGDNAFGRACLQARRLISRGVRFVTVNMFGGVFRRTTWDAHGSAGFGAMDSYGREVGPLFDHAYATLLEDLDGRGLLSSTLVVAGGEFGRTPKINRAGGRDHWPHCWSLLMAGGGVRGGQVIGESDAVGAYPKARPVALREVQASIIHLLGLDTGAALPGPDERRVPIVEPGVEPIHELL